MVSRDDARRRCDGDLINHRTRFTPGGECRLNGSEALDDFIKLSGARRNIFF